MDPNDAVFLGRVDDMPLLFKAIGEHMPPTSTMYIECIKSSTD